MMIKIIAITKFKIKTAVKVQIPPNERNSRNHHQNLQPVVQQNSLRNQTQTATAVPAVRRSAVTSAARG